ncbi:DgyrCDS6406 [Dimorphilus gyrociliatus]|uniref:DgyrCDS6406 n=1 Tax=Dimorphilus gyrociliatus TaxID=2664684 RepID=A0A7I8VSR0_9ANNE|nr:DgyrCDS6406 [Dimorphilus gyrociliatus]
MANCNAVQKEIDKVLSKFAVMKEESAKEIDDVINSFAELKKKIENGGDLQEGEKLFLACNSITRNVLSRISNNHKDLHNQVSKVGKAIDRNFTSDFEAIITDPSFECRNDLLNKSIAEHLIREGRIDITDILARESGMLFTDENHELFLKLHCILEELKNHHLELAIEWAESCKNSFQNTNSHLEFTLHKLQFIKLVKKKQLTECLSYATKHLSKFAVEHTSEFQTLIGCLMYVNKGLENSPYSHLLDAQLWRDAEILLLKEACYLNGLSVESPLSVVINAGCRALPPLLDIKNIMHQRKCNDVWSNKDELPVEIELPNENRYHSIFACPILKQQTSEANPPLRLICGHVISRDALLKLATVNKVKCPYCPVEQQTSEAREICF